MRSRLEFGTTEQNGPVELEAVLAPPNDGAIGPNIW